MTKSEEKKIKEFFNEYAISYRDNGTLRLAVSVDQFIFMTKERMAEREENLAVTLKSTLNKLMVAPPHFGVRESIRIDNAVKLLTSKGKAKADDVEEEKTDDKVEEVKETKSPKKNDKAKSKTKE